MSDSEHPTAAYVSFGTFKNTIAGFANAGLPNRIDRSVLDGMAGGTQNQLIAALKFLRLIEEDGTPTTALTSLAVPDENVRKEALEKLIRERYSALFDLDLKKTTPQQLNERMTEAYRAKGATLERAVRFFLAAIEYVGIPISPLFKKAKRAGNSGTSSRRKAARKTKPQPTTVSPVKPATSGTSKTLQLDSGGSLTLSANIDLFSVSAEDRAFVFELIDKMDEYRGSREDEDADVDLSAEGIDGDDDEVNPAD